MGYILTTLNNLPQHLNCYFFLVGDYTIHDTINNFFRDDFWTIADRIGEDAAIIRQTNYSRVEDELQTAIQKHQFSGTKISSFLDDIVCRAPGLLISQTHPDNWSEDEKFWYFPFEVLSCNYNNTNVLLSDLVDFACGGSKLKDKIKQKPLRFTWGINLGVIFMSKNSQLNQDCF